jgi:hypothetical protein
MDAAECAIPVVHGPHRRCRRRHGGGRRGRGSALPLEGEQLRQRLGMHGDDNFADAIALQGAAAAAVAAAAAAVLGGGTFVGRVGRLRGGVAPLASRPAVTNAVIGAGDGALRAVERGTAPAWVRRDRQTGRQADGQTDGQTDGSQMAVRWQSDGSQMAVRWQSDGKHV